MKIETQPRDDHQVKLTVQFETEDLEGAKRQAARKFAQKVKIPGFRPGKAPYPVILHQVGEAVLLEEALEKLVEEKYPQALKESGLQFYGPGVLNNIVSKEPPVLEFIVPLEAEVALGDYRNLRRPYEPAPVTEAQVDEAIENLRQQNAVVEPVERPAQEGDLVSVRLSSIRTQVEEGQDPTLVRERSMPILVRPEGQVVDEKDKDSANEEWPFVGFSRRLIGLSANDSDSFVYTFPDDTLYESLCGIETEFHFTIETVKSRTLPELNNEFASTVGEFETLEAMRAEIQIGRAHV